MLLGLVRNASLLIDQSPADIWVSTVDVKTFDFATPFDERKHYRLEAIPGVERVEEFNVTYSVWKLPSGGNANCQVIAFDDRGSLAAPLNLVEGSIAALHNQDAVIIDEGEREKLGNVQLGDSVEIMEHRARVVGFTRGMRSFTTTPYIFTSLSRGAHYGWLISDPQLAGGKKSIYFLVKVKPGVDIDTVRAAIMANIPGVEANTRSAFSFRTRKYWLIETGVGLGFLAAAVLGLLVGGVIVSQILYAMTMEKLPEFGVMKALGASMTEISRVVLDQGLICGGVGLLLGIAISYGVGRAAAAVGTSVEIPPVLLVCVGVLTALLCAGAALLSIIRLRRIEPGMVFRT
jgi:putative ABC transport system permease protein